MDILQDLLKRLDKYEVALDKIKSAITYLKHYGYLVDSGDLTVQDVLEAVKKFQEFFGMDGDGELTPKVLRAMEAPRCGCTDLEVEMARDGISKWNKTQLTYFVAKPIGDLDNSTYEQILADAWLEWEKITNIDLRQVDDSDADIIISVGQGSRDGFDGPSGTLAWAYLPNGSDGQLLMRFDMSETWIDDKTKRGILLKNVACHEFGHLLGLSHSKIQGALMAPYYSPNVDKPQSRDDVSRIQSLYGVKSPSPDPTPQPQPNPTPNEKVIITVEGKIEKISIPGYRLSRLE